MAVLCYEAALPEDYLSLNLNSTIINYHVSQSAYEKDFEIEDLELRELGYFIRLKHFLGIEERTEFVLGLRAAENSD